MQTLRKTIRTMTVMATVLAGAALTSGWLSAALAGGDIWGG